MTLHLVCNHVTRKRSRNPSKASLSCSLNFLPKPQIVFPLPDFSPKELWLVKKYYSMVASNVELFCNAVTYHLIWTIYKLKINTKCVKNSEKLAVAPGMDWHHWECWLASIGYWLSLGKTLPLTVLFMHMNCKWRATKLCISWGIFCRFSNASNSSEYKWLSSNIKLH